MTNLTFNILTFNHPSEKYTFHFTNQEQEGLTRFYHKSVPDEVVAHFGEQDHFYTSFDVPLEESLAVTKDSNPSFEIVKNEKGEEEKRMMQNAFYGSAILKRYYSGQIQRYFKSKGLLVKPNFVEDIEVWVPQEEADETYIYFEKYTVRVQFASVTKGLELLITYAGKSKVFNESISDLLKKVSPTCFNWVLYNEGLHRYKYLSDEARRNLSNVYPVWNFDLRVTLGQSTIAPDRTNKYKTFKGNIQTFIEEYLNTEEFKSIIPITHTELTKVEKLKIGKVSDKSNLLLFGNRKFHNVPYMGMDKNGPYDLPEHTNIHFFVITHKSHLDKAKDLMSFFDNGLNGKRYKFKGIQEFAKIPYFVKKGFSIVFDDLEDPLTQIEQEINNRSFEDDIHYMAIYISPFVKDKATSQQKSVYYRVKELLLKKNISSQVIDAAKIKNNESYVFSLNNISIALLAKLQGEPWRLDRPLKKELIIGIGAFRHMATETQYIGSAFSFQNNGSFNYFDCFMQHQTNELAGSILQSVKDFYAYNSGIKRLIIHFYKNMSQKELDPIEKGLKNLDLDIPIFIVSINKTESRDIVAFDEDWDDLMPMSGTFINIGWNKFLLFNNTRYSKDRFFEGDGYPFPIKIGIHCTDKELSKDSRIIKELIDQVYQFSRMYWKSVRQQNLPVTIKYPEMVAEMFPYFEGNEIPDFGKDKLWFL